MDDEEEEEDKGDARGDIVIDDHESLTLGMRSADAGG